ncbi:S8 family serine peptidase [Cryptosporangium sp. NPDC051539]|uniref:S8 family serine peptidase n=1 Tax=Cryptosporangium sp. NPDC051539 TaxID=3363962 RepID=UPI0037900A18
MTAKISAPRPAYLAVLVVAFVMGVAIAAFPGTAAADSVRDQSWQLTSLHVADAHKITRGAGVVVAVIDDGVQTDHPDLVGNVLPGIDIYTGKPQGIENGEYHGTEMAALIAGHGHGPGHRDGVLGIAPDAKILPIKISRDGSLGDANNVTVAIRWALHLGADVISISLAVTYDADLPDALAEAHMKGVPVVVGAGNDRQSALPILDGTVPVMALRQDGTIDPISQGVGKRTGLAAPGSDLPVPTGRDTYAPGTGTSMSTAIVAGGFALARAQFPKLTADQLAALFYRHATDLGDPGPDIIHGNGSLNIVDALADSTLTESSPATALPTSSAVSVTNFDSSWLLTSVLIVGFIVVTLLAVVAALVGIRRRGNRRCAPGPAALPSRTRSTTR